MLCATWVCGCANFQSSGIDPTGQQIFASPPLASPPPTGPSRFQEYPGGPLPWERTQVIVTPARTIAPVGSEVVLIAGVRGNDDYLRTNERVDWMVSPGGVGQLLDYGRWTWRDLMVGDFTWPRKVNNAWAITSTSRQYLRLNRESPVTSDDVCILAGQTWVTVTSAIEGTSYVTALAPNVYGWHARKETATIHWVDAQWRFPPPAINPAGGKHVFTTTVTRHTDGAPCVGWRVRYEIADGPSAGFSPDGAPSVEVATNEAGQASAEIVQLAAVPGTNRINIQVIRPAAMNGSGGKRLVVGSGSTMATWSAPELSVRKSGPATVGVGAEVTYRIDVLNPGDLPAENVQLTDEIPTGFDLLGTNPPAEQTGQQLRWTLGRLDPHQSRSFEVRLRAGGAGSVTTCAEATGAGGLSMRDCATTTVGTPTLDLEVFGPTSARVGDQVNFELIITNRGQVTATGLLIKDRFGEGLQHAVAESPIEKEPGDLPPGQSHRIGVQFRVTRSGSLCHEVEVTGDGGVRVSGRGCVNVAPAAAVAPTTPTTPGRAAISVRKTGPAVGEVGKNVRFGIDVLNTGQVPLTKIEVVLTYDASLRATKVSEGSKRNGNEFTWTIDSLAPGKPVGLGVEYVALTESARACSRVTVKAAEGVEDKAEACLRIRGAAADSGMQTTPGTLPPSLAMTVLEFRDEVEIGKPLSYEILVKNNSLESDRDVVVVVTVPPEMTPSAIGTQGPTAAISASIEGQVIRFTPVAEIRPGDKLRYQVRVTARAVGKVRFRAELTSGRTPKPIVVEEETSIFAK